MTQTGRILKLIWLSVLTSQNLYFKCIALRSVIFLILKGIYHFVSDSMMINLDFQLDRV